ncbi:MAG: hypothetical protein ACTHOG_04890 [Marmoricola sp.]
MANMQSGPNGGAPQQNGPRLRSVIIAITLAALLLFAMFFTWYQHTK